jgi:hypothetical protein
MSDPLNVAKSLVVRALDGSLSPEELEAEYPSTKDRVLNQVLEAIHHYLTDVDIRLADPEYAAAQRRNLERHLLLLGGD